MKYSQTISTLLFAFFCIVIPVHAASPTPTQTASASGTPSATPTQKQTAIDDLKERLATKVAELRQSQKKAIAGIVKALSVSTLTVETKTSDIKIELSDSMSVFQMIKGKRTALTTDALEKNDMVVLFGDYDTSLDLMKAKVIVIQDPLPKRTWGTITNVDKKEYTITIETPEKTSYIIDIEKYTTINSLNSQKTIEKSGFSKIEIGSIAHIIGEANAKDASRMSAERILTLPNLAQPKSTPSLTPEASASATPSVGLTPKSSPTGTPKQ